MHRRGVRETSPLRLVGVFFFFLGGGRTFSPPPPSLSLPAYATKATLAGTGEAVGGAYARSPFAIWLSRERRNAAKTPPPPPSAPLSCRFGRAPKRKSAERKRKICRRRNAKIIKTHIYTRYIHARRGDIRREGTRAPPEVSPADVRPDGEDTFDPGDGTTAWPAVWGAGSEQRGFAPHWPMATW